MHPILFKIGPFTIYTYGVLVAAGFLLGLGLAVRQAKKEGILTGRIVDLGFYILLAALVGSRLFFVLMNAPHYIKNPIEILKIWEGGLVFYGGFLLAIPIVLWYVKRHTMDLWSTADLFAPSIAIGHALGRLGCFSAGCCYGRPAPDLPWAVTFRDPQSLALQGIPLHPTQLYEAFGVFINFFILIMLRRHKSFNGQLFFSYLLIYSVLRFIVEFFRGDLGRGFISPYLSLPQAMSAAIFVAAVIGLVVLRKRKLQV